MGLGPNEASASGVSWSAVFAGSAVTAALGLILLALGTGLGLSSVSVWSNVGASANTIGGAAIGWLIAVEVISSAMGGYLAGRLRTKWASIHTDEVYFRDTAHGFLAWSVALIITVAFLGAAGTTFMGKSSTASGADHNGQTVSGGEAFDPSAYFIDLMFREDGSKPTVEDTASRREASVIMANALRKGDLSREDQRYLGQLVSAKTQLNQSDAEARVSQDFKQAEDSAEAARKLVAHSLLWAFVALLIGAFCASFAATIGGRQRDHVVVLP
jgi:hypothetical protein